MRQFRLSTLMQLIVFTALGVAVVVQQQQRADRREAELRAQLAQPLPVVLPPQQQKTRMRMPTDDERDLIKRLNEQLSGK